MADEKSAMTVWIAIACVAVALFAFTGGYYAGAVLSTHEGITVVDDYGRQIKLNEVPQRIVSISPTTTEVLFAVGAGAQLVGVDDYSDYPAEALNLTKVGNALELNVEAIIGLNPDLVVTGDLVPLALNQVQDRGIPYMVIATRTLDDVIKDVRLMGAVTGHVDEADILATSLEERIDAVRNVTLAPAFDRPKVYLEYFEYYTFGPGSFGDDLIRSAGGINIAANTSSEYPVITPEFVVAADPDIIVYTVGYMAPSPDDFASRPGWGDITAVKDGALYSIDENLVSRYGPRVVDGLEQLAAILHPDLFD